MPFSFSISTLSPGFPSTSNSESDTFISTPVLFFSINLTYAVLYTSTLASLFSSNLSKCIVEIFPSKLKIPVFTVCHS